MGNAGSERIVSAIPEESRDGLVMVSRQNV